jgi:ketosteroid isomerase-like protein
VRGREAIRPRYVALFEQFDPAIEARVDEACVSGAVAFVRGHNGGRLSARGAGAGRALDDLYLMLLRRDAGGAWRISHLMWHRAGP